MGTPLRVLIVEDSVDDTELVLRQLRRAGYDPVSERVQTAEEMKTALEREAWDLVVSDYTMPQFAAPTALNLLNQSGRDIPFIVVSGSIGEDIAVAMMKTGAHDYILKQNLTRFIPAVQRELREAENRRHQRLSEQAKQRLQLERDGFLEQLKQEHEDLTALTRVTANAISTLDLDELLRVLLERIVEVMRADSATILLADGAELRVRASVGTVNFSDTTDVVLMGEGFAGSVATRKKPMYVEDAAVDPLVTDPLIRERGIRSLLGVPLKRNGTLIGVLHVDWLTVRPCRDREVHLLEITAERCAAAIQNAQLYQEAKRIAAALTESETHLRQLSSAIEQTADSVLITDRNGVIEYVNPAFRRTTGYASEEVIGKTPRFLKSGKHDQKLYETLWKTILGGETFLAEFVNRKKSGDLYHTEHSINAIRDTHGHITHFVSTGRDITGRKLAEVALQESERIRRLVLDNVDEIAYMIELGMDGMLSGRVRFVSGRVEQILGYQPEEFIRDPELWFGIIHPDDAPALAERTQVIFASGQPGIREYRVRHKLTGDYHWMEDHVVPQLDTAGRVVSQFGVARDITERKQFEGQMLRTQRLESIGTLAGGVAHDLNNALAPIMMATELLRLEFPESGTQYLGIIQDSARRGADMVKQLLTFAKGVEGERLLLQPTHLLKEIEKLIKSTFPKNIELRISYAKDLSTLLGDATQLHQVLLNLCVNARDAMPNGGTLTLKTENVKVDTVYADAVSGSKPGHFVLWSVTDTGTGIPPEILERIFEPFFSTKSPDKGTGLGLSTAIGIVKSHGGFVRVYSVPRQGSTFTVYLPVSSSDAGDTSLLAKVEATFRGNGETILVVDDEATVREITRAVLTALNFKVLTASDGTAALIQVTENRAMLRAVITDLHMPGMDGLAFVRVLKGRFPQTGIIVVSGRMDEREEHEFKALGVNVLLDKPFTQEKLVAALKTVFQK